MSQSMNHCFKFLKFQIICELQKQSKTPKNSIRSTDPKFEELKKFRLTERTPRDETEMISLKLKNEHQIEGLFFCKFKSCDWSDAIVGNSVETSVETVGDLECAEIDILITLWSLNVKNEKKIAKSWKPFTASWYSLRSGALTSAIVQLRSQCPVVLALLLRLFSHDQKSFIVCQRSPDYYATVRLAGSLAISLRSFQSRIFALLNFTSFICLYLVTTGHSEKVTRRRSHSDSIIHALQQTERASLEWGF